MRGMYTAALGTMLACGLAGACGSAPGQGELTSPVARSERGDGFTLAVLPASFDPGGTAQSFSMHQAQAAGELEVELRVNGARGLKAAYLELQYDAGRWSPLTAQPGPALGNADDVLWVCVLHEPGVVHCGQVLRNFAKRPGCTGDGLLARLRFTRQAFGAAHRACVPPDPLPPSLQLNYDASECKLWWYYGNGGDYNQNGMVELSDLTPLGRFFGLALTPPDKFPEDSALFMIDGNNDGSVDIQDLAPIGICWKRHVTGYNAYHSLYESDYHPYITGPPQQDFWLGQVSFAEALGGVDEHKRFELRVFTPIAGEYYWVRPASGASDGIASTLVQCPLGGPP